MGLLLLTERTQERLSRAPRAPFHRAVDHWAARCTMMYPLIGQYVAQDWAVDMSGRGRHMTTHYGGGGSIFPSREILRGNYVAAPDALTPDIECLFLPQDLTAKGLGVPAVAEDFGDFDYYTVIVWCAAQKNIAFSHYGQMFGSFNAGTVDYNFRLDFRYGDGGPTGSRDYPAFVGQGGNGAVGADNSMVPYYERATMFVGRYDKDVTLEYNLVLNDFEFEVSGNDPLVGSRSFIADSVTSFGNRTDSVGSFRSPGPVWNARYMTRAISDDEILALYEQPWLGYEEYGRTLISIPAAAASASYAPVGTGGGLVGRTRGLVA